MRRYDTKPLSQLCDAPTWLPLVAAVSLAFESLLYSPAPTSWDNKLASGYRQVFCARLLFTLGL